MAVSTLSLRARWLARNTQRVFLLLWWLGTGRFSRAVEASLPYYRRYIPLHVRGRIPHKLRWTVRRWLSDDYRTWITRNDTLSTRDRGLIRNHIGSFQSKPRFSILMHVCDVSPVYLRQAIDSVQSQLYEYWELSIVYNASSRPRIRSILEGYAQQDVRIRPYFYDMHCFSACMNKAFEMATGDWVVLMDQNDALSEHTLYLVAEAINSKPDTAIIYSDEDHVDRKGRRTNPYFKPDWDDELFLTRNLIGRLGAYRMDLARKVGGFRTGFEGAQEWDFALRVLDAASNAKVHHLPFVLYHRRRANNASPSPLTASATETAQLAVNEHLQRSGKPAIAMLEDHSGHLRIKWHLPETRPLVSIIIPTRDRCDLLRTCIDGLFNRTDYRPFEIVIVDNGSREADTLTFLASLRSRDNVKVIEDRGPFNFSRLVNRGVSASSGEICVLLNNDIDVINSDWLDEMVSHALRPEVGAVGAKLYYANDTLQHGGVVLGLGGVAGHAHRFLPRESAGYYNRLRLTHNLSCVTAACLAIRREVYDRLGGFNEHDLPITLNDVDFCIRVRKAGYKIIFTPHAELYHYEGISRRRDGTPENAARAHTERAYMRRHWGPVLDNDPFYNPNLALDTEAFGLATVTRVRKPWLLWSDSRLSGTAPAISRKKISVESRQKISHQAFSKLEQNRWLVNVVNFVAVYGNPDSGKSSLARKLAEDDGILWIHADGIFARDIAPNLVNLKDFWSYRHWPEGEMNIGPYIDSDSYDHGQFVRYLNKKLHQQLDKAQNVHIVLLDGYVFKHYARIFAELDLPLERTLALHASVVDGRYLLDGFDVTGHHYSEVFKYIRESFRRKCLESTVPKSTYQNFESLGIYSPRSGKTSSETLQKYDSSHLDNLVRGPDRIVDVGCNAGYFCFRLAEKTEGVVMCVDIARRPLEIASHINNSIFLRNNIVFFQSDAVDFLSEHRNAFEIIHCGSTYHYLRERQLDFLHAARLALSREGMLVLEVELANEGMDPEIFWRSRGVDSTPCAFPSRSMFLQQIQGLFLIQAEFPSVFQRGSLYDRMYFHLCPQ